VKKGMTRFTSVFDFSEVDINDPEAMEKAWNDWVRGLFLAGFRPSEHPLPGRETETTITYRLFRLDAGVQPIGEVA
jgi:hypothetical protein